MNHQTILAGPYISAFAISMLLGGCAAMPEDRYKAAHDELIAKGGRVLTKDELKALLSGAVVSGPGRQGFLRTEFNSNGTLIGVNTQAAVVPIHYSGTWSVNDRNQNCWETSGSWDYGSFRDIDCATWFRVGDDYYTIGERRGNVSKRVVTRQSDTSR